MKTSIATSLSVIAVLAAGVAAFSVNSSVLDSAQASGLSSTAAPVSIAGTDGASPVGDVSVSSTSDSTTTYQVGTSGSVVIDTSSGEIHVTNVLPSTGWTSEPATTDADGSTKVHFSHDTTRIEFVARLVNGKTQATSSIDVVRQPAASVNSPTNSVKASPPKSDDGDDGDDHGDDGEYSDSGGENDDDD